MNLLLDTHIALWALADHPNLSKKAKGLITDPDNTIYFSSVSVWEILLNHDSPSNNLTLTPADFVQYCEDAGYIPLNMKPEHVITASKLEASTIDKQHSDPFDRLLLAQAKTENLVFLTHDVKFSLCKERCVRMV